jgi:hypothetical protein
MLYFVEIPLDGAKSQAPLHTPWQRQFNKMADHVRLTVEQRAKFVVLFAETKGVIAMQKTFRTLFWTRRAPAKKKKDFLFSLFKTLEGEWSWKEGKRPSPRSVRSAETVGLLLVAIQDSSVEINMKCSS